MASRASQLWKPPGHESSSQPRTEIASHVPVYAAIRSSVRTPTAGCQLERAGTRGGPEEPHVGADAEGRGLQTAVVGTAAGCAARVVGELTLADDGQGNVAEIVRRRGHAQEDRRAGLAEPDEDAARGRAHPAAVWSVHEKGSEVMQQPLVDSMG